MVHEPWRQNTIPQRRSDVLPRPSPRPCSAGHIVSHQIQLHIDHDLGQAFIYHAWYGRSVCSSNKSILDIASLEGDATGRTLRDLKRDVARARGISS